jgi:phosphotransferase system  glucose/maltose/N-acetylglucosamine-specific IIC component
MPAAFFQLRPLLREPASVPFDMLLSSRSRKLLQAARLVAALAGTALVVAVWTVPAALNALWMMLAFFVFGLPGAVATFVIKADNERRANVR